MTVIFINFRVFSVKWRYLRTAVLDVDDVCGGDGHGEGEGEDKVAEHVDW